jgi:hypothetical protein
MEHIAIFDLLGKKVMEQTLCRCPFQKVETMDISSLPAGMYFVKIQTANGVVVEKVVKE